MQVLNRDTLSRPILMSVQPLILLSMLMVLCLQTTVSRQHRRLRDRMETALSAAVISATGPPPTTTRTLLLISCDPSDTADSAAHAPDFTASPGDFPGPTDSIDLADLAGSASSALLTRLNPPLAWSSVRLPSSNCSHGVSDLVWSRQDTVTVLNTAASLALAGAAPRFWAAAGVVLTSDRWCEDLLRSAAARRVLRLLCVQGDGRLFQRRQFVPTGTPRVQEVSVDRPPVIQISAADLFGQPLRVVYQLQAPFLYRRKTSGDREPLSLRRLDGLEADLLSAFTSTHRVQLQLVPNPQPGEWGRPVNGTWRGLLGAVAADRADMAVGDVSVTEERSGAVDFPPPLLFSDVVYVTRWTAAGPAWSRFLQPYQSGVWALLAASGTLWAGCAVWLAARCGRSWQAGMLEAVRVPLAQSVTRVPAGGLPRALLAVWLLAWYVIVLAYSATLVSHLTQSESLVGVSTPEGLISGGFSITTPATNSALRAAQLCQPGLGRALAERTVLVANLSVPAALAALSADHALMEERAIVMPLLAGRPELRAAEPGLFPTVLSWPVQRHSPWQPLVGRFLSLMQQSGILQLAVRRHLTPPSRPVPATGARHALGRRHLSGPFDLLLAGLAVAGLTFCVELMVHRLTSAEQQTDQPARSQQCRTETAPSTTAPPRREQHQRPESPGVDLTAAASRVCSTHES